MPTGYEVQMYGHIAQIARSLDRIATTLDRLASVAEHNPGVAPTNGQVQSYLDRWATKHVDPKTEDRDKVESVIEMLQETYPGD